MVGGKGESEFPKELPPKLLDTIGFKFLPGSPFSKTNAAPAFDTGKWRWKPRRPELHWTPWYLPSTLASQSSRSLSSLGTVSIRLHSLPSILPLMCFPCSDSVGENWCFLDAWRLFCLAVYPGSSIADLSAVDAALKAMELQVQSIKDRLREETEAVPKAKVSVPALFLVLWVVGLCQFESLDLVWMQLKWRWYYLGASDKSNWPRFVIIDAAHIYYGTKTLYLKLLLASSEVDLWLSL